MKLALVCFILACWTLAAQSQEPLMSEVRTYHQQTSYQQRCEATCYSQRGPMRVSRDCPVNNYCAVICTDPLQPRLLCLRIPER